MKTLALKVRSHPRSTAQKKYKNSKIILLSEYTLYKRKKIAFLQNGEYKTLDLSSIKMIKREGNKSVLSCFEKEDFLTPMSFNYWEKIVENFGFFTIGLNQISNKFHFSN